MLDHIDCHHQMHIMIEWLDTIWDDYFWASAACICACVVVFSALADRKRAQRSQIDAVGFMPWAAITLVSVLMTLVSIAFAVKSA
jgi:hypothetical protein